METQKLGKFIEKWHIKKDDWRGSKKLEVLGVSNVDGITATSHKKSKDLSKYLVIEPNYFAYNPYRINVGSIGLTPEESYGLVSPAYTVFKVKENRIIPELLLNFLKSFDGLQQINKYARGTVRKSLRYDDLCEIKVNFPSYEKQKKIFKKKLSIEAKQIELSNEILTQKQLISQLKQAILQDAVQGKLTQEWREQNPNKESANKLFQRIKDVKEQLIKDKKIRRGNFKLKINDEEKPKGFNEIKNWVRLGDLCYVQKGNTGIQKSIPGEYPLVVTAENRLSHIDYQFDCKAVIVPLVSSTGHGHASLKRIHYQENKFAVGTILACIYPFCNDILNMKFLYHYLDTYKKMFFVQGWC